MPASGVVPHRLQAGTRGLVVVVKEGGVGWRYWT